MQNEKNKTFFGAVVVDCAEEQKAYIKIENDWLVAYERKEVDNQNTPIEVAFWETDLSNPRTSIQDAIGFCIRECMYSQMYIARTDVSRIKKRYGKRLPTTEKKSVSIQKMDKIEACIMRISKRA